LISCFKIISVSTGHCIKTCSILTSSYLPIPLYFCCLWKEFKRIKILSVYICSATFYSFSYYSDCSDSFHQSVINLHFGGNSAVGIATGYGLYDRGFGVRVPVRSRIFSSSRRPDRPWGQPNFLSNGYRGLLSRE
jgi:hypothetical protein